jgi:hypothetical protein
MTALRWLWSFATEIATEILPRYWMRELFLQKRLLLPHGSSISGCDFPCVTYRGGQGGTLLGDAGGHGVRICHVAAHEAVAGDARVEGEDGVIYFGLCAHRSVGRRLLC